MSIQKTDDRALLTFSHTFKSQKGKITNQKKVHVIRSLTRSGSVLLMEFAYKKGLFWKYAVGMIVFVLVLIITPLSPRIFLIPGIIFGLFGLVHAISSYKRLIEIITTRIIIERRGIYFYRKKEKNLFLPWEDIDDYSITETRCLVRIGNQLHTITRELQNFEEFERLLIGQLSLPAKKRGATLPEIEAPEGYEDITIPGEHIPGPPSISDIQPDREKDALEKETSEPTITGESPAERLAKLGLREKVNKKFMEISPPPKMMPVTEKATKTPVESTQKMKEHTPETQSSPIKASKAAPVQALDTVKAAAEKVKESPKKAEEPAPTVKDKESIYKQSPRYGPDYSGKKTSKKAKFDPTGASRYASGPKFGPRKSEESSTAKKLAQKGTHKLEKKIGKKSLKMKRKNLRRKKS